MIHQILVWAFMAAFALFCVFALISVSKWQAGSAWHSSAKTCAILAASLIGLFHLCGITSPNGGDSLKPESIAQTACFAAAWNAADNGSQRLMSAPDPLLDEVTPTDGKGFHVKLVRGGISDAQCPTRWEAECDYSDDKATVTVNFHQTDRYIACN